MSPAALKGLIAAAIVAALINLLRIGLRQLFIAGGTPQQRGTAIHYRLRPFARILQFIFAIAGLAMILSAILNFRAGKIGAGIFLLILGLSSLGIATMQQSEIILDNTGVRYRAVFGPVKTIPWDDLSHVEQLSNTSTMIRRYFIRSTTGATITAANTIFNTSDLLEKIRARSPLPEMPYQSKSWYSE